MKQIAYTRPDGGVSVVMPAPEFMSRFSTEAEGLAAVRARAVPADATDIVEIEDTDVPADREFRDAWRLNGGVIEPEVAAARVVQTALIDQARRIRARDLVEREAMGEDVSAERTALAVKPNLDAAADLQAIRAAWPAGLPRP